MNDDRDQRRWASSLGRAGWLPFAALLALAWAMPESGWPVQVFKIWSALVLTFIGALRWGFALSGAGHRHDYLLGILPSAVAVVALLLSAPAALLLLGTGFVVLLSLDWWAPPPGMPDWFRRLRVQLTVGVVLLHAGLAALLLVR